ncbi:MAG TPA: hypothetical protein PKM27_02825 [Saprospiraceae bacterium]|nr:hypothetical protein [Saprospiraceae bacterium]HNT19006.1 hypothetical protein [Saprospiraceae bacterium]
MTNTPEHIRETLELYDRGELDPSRLLEVQALLRSDPAWQAAWRSFRSETAGIRLNRLKTNLSVLESLEAELKDPEKKTAAGGDPGAVLTSSPESNHIKQASETSQPESMEETIDRNTSEGIRFSRLHQALNGLKAEEKKTADPRPAGGRILVIRRIWLGAIAAGIIGFFLVMQLFNNLNRPKYINQYLITHFDEYILHEKSRSKSEKLTFNKDKEIGYDLFVLQEFTEALPYLQKSWLNSNDTLSFFYLTVSHAALGNNKYFREYKSSPVLQSQLYQILLNKIK